LAGVPPPNPEAEVAKAQAEAEAEPYCLYEIVYPIEV